MYCPGCGRGVQEDLRFCPYCGRPIGENAVVVQQTPVTQKKGIGGPTIAAIVVVAVVAVIAVILILSIGLSSIAGSSATVRVTINSTNVLYVASYDVYFDGTHVKSGTVGPLDSDSFTHTYRWSSSDSTTVAVSVESSGGFLGIFYDDERTITVTDGGHYSVSLYI
jgi:hypothetical protein